MNDIPYPKKALSEAISTIIDETVQLSAEQTHTGSTSEDMDELNEIYIPDSIMLMASILHKAIELNSPSIDYDDLGLNIDYNVKKGNYIFVFHHTNGSPNIARDEPYYHEEVAAFLSKLCEYGYNKIKIKPKKLSISFKEKMPLFRMINDYLEDPDNNITHADNVKFALDESYNVPFNNPAHDEQVHPQIRDHILKKAIGLVKTLYNDEEMAEQFLFFVPTRPYTNLDAFHAACGATNYADINYSMEHILKTIIFEDRIDPKTLYECDLTLSAGGYH